MLLQLYTSSGHRVAGVSVCTFMLSTVFKKTSGGTGTGINLNRRMNSETFTDSETFFNFTLCLTCLIQHALLSLFYSLLYFCTVPHVLHDCKCNSTNILSNVFGIIPAFLTQFSFFSYLYIHIFLLPFYCILCNNMKLTLQGC